MPFLMPPRCHGLCGSQKKSRQSDLFLDRGVPSELTTVIVGDRAQGCCGQAAQFFDDGAGGLVGVLAVKTPGQRQPRASFLQCQQDVALAAEVHAVTFPVAELRAFFLNDGRALRDRDAVLDGRFALAVPGSPSASGFALRQVFRQAVPPNGRAEDVAESTRC